MEKLRAKLKNQGGFTLVEMLIVVAIIAILIAVSIPMMNNALEKSREAVDTANERDAKALAIIAYMTFDKGSTDATETGINSSDGGTAYYKVDSNLGSLVKESTGIVPYGQGTASGANTTPHTGEIIKVTVTPPAAGDANPTVTIEWEQP